MLRIVFLILLAVLLTSCHSSKTSTKVLRPKTHNVWPAGNKYLIDIPVGVRHIHLFKRRTTKTQTLKINY
ncbi:MAG: hypothetical protein OJF59_002417 [Cytophagales bacterium]|jgi:hypothetical protein|nr:hypothetical protein [Bacteroidota bacterium]MBS1980152.1 hypothetical protein [Bacteroidota bacterium]WHZ08663.1 MAG: hypothetical protein OJF59_002417 [Cytophagales bacterium]